MVTSQRVKNLKMISQNNKPEILSFTYQEIYLDRILIKSRDDLIKHIKYLSKKYKYPAKKILFHHDFMDMSEKQCSFMGNFTKKNSYDYLKKALVKSKSKHLNTKYTHKLI